MKHVVRWIDDLIDGIIGLFLVLLLLLGTYFVYDTLWVYYNASSDRVSAYKPGGEGELLPLSEDCVAWLTIDDTNIDHPIMQGETNGKYLNTDPYGNTPSPAPFFWTAGTPVTFPTATLWFTATIWRTA